MAFLFLLKDFKMLLSLMFYVLTTTYPIMNLNYLASYFGFVFISGTYAFIHFRKFSAITYSKNFFLHYSLISPPETTSILMWKPLYIAPRHFNFFNLIVSLFHCTIWEFLSTVFQFTNLLFNCVQSVMDPIYCTL